MTWTLARGRQRCSGCGARIHTGDACRPLRVRGVFCAACALKVLHETPPDPSGPSVPPSPAVPARPLESLARRIGRQLGIDVKRAQSGDDQ